MTLAATLLPKLNDWRPSGDGRHTCSISLPEQGWTAGITANKVDTIGCLLRELTLTRVPDFASGVSTPLRAWAEHIVAKTTGLLEPLRIYEIDTVANIALLRSDKPTTTNQLLAYYEVVLEGHQRATLRRYEVKRASGDGPRYDHRMQVNFTLTHEGLCHVAESFAS